VLSIPYLAVLADIFPGGGSPVADVFAVAIAVALFALLYWAIDLIERI
jgi:preprotein translocase subunit SecE